MGASFAIITANHMIAKYSLIARCNMYSQLFVYSCDQEVFIPCSNKAKSGQ